MKHSTDRILSTHIGSLPRPPAVLAAIEAHRKGAPLDQALIRSAIRDSVRKQTAIGLDVINDGEFSKPSFVSYIQERLSGFEPDANPAKVSAFSDSKESRAFPDFYKVAPSPGAPRMICTAPIRYVGQDLVKADIENLRSALADVKVEEAFIPSISPTNVAALHRNAFYASTEEYNIALADALHEEYQTIIEAGFILQVDDPHLMTHYVKEADLTMEEARRWASFRVDILNHALKGIPTDRVRFHTCAGINIGPRVNDMPLESMVDILLRIEAGAYSFEYGNPRHEHEWAVWKTAGLPDDRILIPGVISNSTVLVEHPELVAERITRFADVVGRERVMAGADCGFASSATSEDFPESIVWEKLKSLTEGSRIASRRLWGR